MMGATPLVMALALGDILGMKPEFAFSRFPNCPSNAPFKAILAKQPLAFPKQILTSGVSFTCTELDVLRDYCRDDVQYAVVYKSEYGDILVFATRETAPDGKDAFRIGFRSPDAVLPSRELMASSPNASVMMCLDPAVTIKMRQIAREARLLERCGMIVSGLYGGQSEVDAMDWTPLTFRDVTILTSPDQPGWPLVAAVVKRCRDVGANSIRVWPWPIVQEGQRPDISVLPIKAREPFASMTAVIDRIEVPSAFVERIKGEAIPFEGLQHWEEAMGFHPAASCTTEAAMSDKNRLKVLTYDEMPIMPMRPIGSPVMVDEMFNSANTSFMYGPSNTGKSWLAIQLSIAKACGSNFFFLGKSAPQRVLYIDGEIGNGFRSRIDQLFDGNHNNIQLIRKNFIAISQRGLRISDMRTFDELMSIINEKEDKVRKVSHNPEMT